MTDAEIHLQRIKRKCEQNTNNNLSGRKDKDVHFNTRCQNQRGWAGAYPPIRELLQNSFDYLDLIGDDGFLKQTVDVSRSDTSLCFNIANTRVLAIRLEVCTHVAVQPTGHN